MNGMRGHTASSTCAAGKVAGSFGVVTVAVAVAFVAGNGITFGIGAFVVTDGRGALNSNTFIYGQNGRLEVSTNVRGFSTTNYYSNDTDQLIATRDALGNVASNSYVGGLLTGTRNALETVTTNFYDDTGNLIGTAMVEASSKIFSTNTYDYDANGNQTNSVTWRRNSSGTWVGATNTSVYDAQNRIVKTIAPDGGETLTVYNEANRITPCDIRIAETAALGECIILGNDTETTDEMC